MVVLCFLRFRGSRRAHGVLAQFARSLGVRKAVFETAVDSWTRFLFRQADRHGGIEQGIVCPLLVFDGSGVLAEFECGLVERVVPTALLGVDDIAVLIAQNSVEVTVGGFPRVEQRGLLPLLAFFLGLFEVSRLMSALVRTGSSSMRPGRSEKSMGSPFCQRGIEGAIVEQRRGKGQEAAASDEIKGRAKLDFFFDFITVRVPKKHMVSAPGLLVERVFREGRPKLLACGVTIRVQSDDAGVLAGYHRNVRIWEQLEPSA